MHIKDFFNQANGAVDWHDTILYLFKTPSAKQRL